MIPHYVLFIDTIFLSPKIKMQNQSLIALKKAKAYCISVKSTEELTKFKTCLERPMLSPIARSKPKFKKKIAETANIRVLYNNIWVY